MKYLWPTMSQNLLNNLNLISIEFWNNLYYQGVIDDFTAKNIKKIVIKIIDNIFLS